MMVNSEYASSSSTSFSSTIDTNGKWEINEKRTNKEQAHENGIWYFDYSTDGVTKYAAWAHCIGKWNEMQYSTHISNFGAQLKLNVFCLSIATFVFARFDMVFDQLIVYLSHVARKTPTKYFIKASTRTSSYRCALFAFTINNHFEQWICNFAGNKWCMDAYIPVCASASEPKMYQAIHNDICRAFYGSNFHCLILFFICLLCFTHAMDSN